MPDVCLPLLQTLDREAWLGHFHKGYLELDREQPFFDTLGDFRTHIAKCEEHVITALSEVREYSIELDTTYFIGQLHYLPACASSIYMVPRKHIPIQHVSDSWLSRSAQKTSQAYAMIVVQVYMGSWAGRRWFFPTVFYHNLLRQPSGWHMPEQACSWSDVIRTHVKPLPNVSQLSSYPSNSGQ